MCENTSKIIVEMMEKEFQQIDNKQNAQLFLFKREENLHVIEEQINSMKMHLQNMHIEKAQGNWNGELEQGLVYGLKILSELEIDYALRSQLLSRLQKELDPIETPDFIVSLMKEAGEGSE